MSKLSRKLRNRLNAQLSTGPQTAEGKAASSQNAMTHGLTSRQIVLPGENASEYDAQRETLHRELHPNTELERTLVDEIAACAWRLARARAVETAAYAKLVADAPDAVEALAAILLDRPKEITRIQRYVTSFERAYYRALNQLKAVRKEEEKRLAKEDEWDISKIWAKPQEMPVASTAQTSGFVSQNEFEPLDVEAEIEKLEQETPLYYRAAGA